MRAVLVVIADAANRDGEHARPGINAIVDGSLYGRSHVYSTLRKLESEGWIEVEERARKHGHADVYRLVMGQTEGPESVTVQPLDGSPPPCRSVQQPSNPTPPNVQSGPISPSNATVNRDGNDVLRDFEAFWAVYPRHEGKESARHAWDKAKRRVAPETIIAGAKRHANDPNRDPSYTKHPATWLNAGCWDDDLLPPRVLSTGQVFSGTAEQRRLDAMREVNARFIEEETGMGR